MIAHDDGLGGARCHRHRLAGRWLSDDITMMLWARKEHWLRILIERTEKAEAKPVGPTLVVINGGREICQ